MDRQARIDNALREAELARTQYFEGAVTDAEYVMRMAALFTEVAFDAATKFQEQFAPPTDVELLTPVRSNLLPFTPHNK